MKLSRVAINRFGREEYEGFTQPNVDGEDFLILGGNRTGKTLTFNALLYNLLGSENTIDLSTGRSNDVALTFDDGTTFKRGQPEARWSASTVLEGEEARDQFTEYLADNLTQEIEASELIKTHFLHSNRERLPLSQLTGTERLALIRAVVDNDTQDRIEQNTERIEGLEEEVEQYRSKLRRAKEDQQELRGQLSSDENQLGKYEQIAELRDSGDLRDLCELLQRDTELSERIGELSKERNGLRQEKRSKSKLKWKWERYREEERNSVIAKAVNDFVCPACADRVSEELAENRISNDRCPFCAVKGRSDDIAADVEDKIHRSEDEIEELEVEIENINNRIEEIDEEVAQLHERQPDLNGLSTPIERVLRTNDYGFAAIVEEMESELEKYSQSINEVNEKLETLDSEISEYEEVIEEHRVTIAQLEEENEQIRTESIHEEIQTFTDHWSDEYQTAAGEIGLEIGLTSDGEVHIPGNETNRNYNSAGELSGAEILFLNISFATTVNAFVREENITEWEVIVMDEPFAALDNEATENLLDYMSSSELQFICTTSDDSMTASFDKTTQLERQDIQSTIQRFIA